MPFLGYYHLFLKSFKRSRDPIAYPYTAVSSVRKPDLKCLACCYARCRRWMRRQVRAITTYDVDSAARCRKMLLHHHHQQRTSTSEYVRALRHSHSAVVATELLQPRDLARGTLFQSSCVIPTSPTDCSDATAQGTPFSGRMNTALCDF